MTGIKRKVVHATLYELIAISMVSPILTYVFHKELGTTVVLSAIVSVIAVTWNIVFNYAFEAFERKIGNTARPTIMRVAHTVLFEVGLILFLVPLFAYWLHISLVTAFLTDLGLMSFFLLYTFVYNICFDRIFGLPQ
jgi:uncharacterized membrane protein